MVIGRQDVITHDVHYDLIPCNLSLLLSFNHTTAKERSRPKPSYCCNLSNARVLLLLGVDGSRFRVRLNQQPPMHHEGWMVGSCSVWRFIQDIRYRRYPNQDIWYEHLFPSTYTC